MVGNLSKNRDDLAEMVWDPFKASLEGLTLECVWSTKYVPGFVLKASEAISHLHPFKYQMR